MPQHELNPSLINAGSQSEIRLIYTLPDCLKMGLDEIIVNIPTMDIYLLEKDHPEGLSHAHHYCQYSLFHT